MKTHFSVNLIAHLSTKFPVIIATRLLVVAVLLTVIICPSKGQQTHPWEQYLDRVMNVEDLDEDDQTALFDQLADLAENPIDLNRATRIELEALPFLTAQQVQDISEYLYHYGSIKSLGELAMIPSLNWDQQQLLRFFVRVEENPTPQDSLANTSLFVHPHHEFVGMLKVPFYERQGDKKGYAGPPLRHWLRYMFTASSHIQAGFTASQDAGEPWFANKNGVGYDFYSFYVQLQEIGRLKRFVAGRYRLRFGQGLIMNTALDFGKLFALSSLARAGTTLRGFSSRSDATYLQGAAVTLNLCKDVDLTLFASYRNLDATLNDDSTSVATLLHSGLHRTQSELNRKGNTRQWLAGGHAEWNSSGFHVGLTGYGTGLNRSLLPDKSTLYLRYSPEGANFWNVSTDYSYTSHFLSISGETATGDSKAIATINTASVQLSNGLSMMAIQRFYSCRFNSLFSRTFSEGGHTQNESGIYGGIAWNPSRSLSVMAYTDYAYFAWARYLISKPSHVWDNYISVNWQHRNLGLMGRYRYRRKQTDDVDHTALLDINEHRARLTLTISPGNWRLRSQLDGVMSGSKDQYFGGMISQQAGFQSGHLQMDLSVNAFSTQDWSCRVYAYEPGLFYTLSFNTFSGRGCHAALRAQWAFNSHYIAVVRLSGTNYFDRDQISSGLEQINNPFMSAAEVQLKVRL